MKIRKGDTVKVMRGKDRGKTGTVDKIMIREQKALVGGVNIYKKHIKPRQGQRGSIVEIVKPLSLAGLRVICPTCHKPTRVGWEVGKTGKERICKKCGAAIDKQKTKD
ncbi:50S ribosomal protein L24 [Candidatus Beckwithbacteria bacterium RBG_13_42_9]|uniref:Large ribosomal subunit protein uL24 n=1 Tax=Candidatus Beckwithbacteria bacterium RBG_13_42_9 TaxID=1797457 RepID=A0A1F5E8Z0_9BACT|nr:MAG: 50S ribosomal protein L24 [Candidatus Beckwithbacteria bacterium RBG_13_42_9]